MKIKIPENARVIIIERVASSGKNTLQQLEKVLFHFINYLYLFF